MHLVNSAPGTWSLPGLPWLVYNYVFKSDDATSKLSSLSFTHARDEIFARLSTLDQRSKSQIVQRIIMAVVVTAQKGDVPPKEERIAGKHTIFIECPN